jgi:type VI secretion system protein ImpL
LLSRATSAAADVAGNAGAQTVAAAASALNPTAAPAVPTFDPWPGDAIRAPFLPLLSLLEARNGQAPVLVVQSTVAGTYSALLPVSTAPVPKVAAQALAARVISGQAADPLIGLRVQAATLPKPINGIFRDLYSNAWSALLSLSLEQVQTVWSQDIAPVCEQSISGRYPFVTNSGEREATLRDFSNFFGPGGLLEKFVSANLLMFAQIGPDGGLTVSSQNGLSLNLSRDALEAINHARKMRDVYFGGDGTLSVRFALTPSYLDPRALAATFAVDQTRLTYRHEPPRAVGFTWPSTAESTASLSVETTDGMRPELQASGPWAVFHVLDQAVKSLGPSRDQIQIMFKLGDIRVGYNLRASSVVNPMMATDVREFRCVPRL